VIQVQDCALLHLVDVDVDDVVVVVVVV